MPPHLNGSTTFIAKVRIAAVVHTGHSVAVITSTFIRDLTLVIISENMTGRRNDLRTNDP